MAIVYNNEYLGKSKLGLGCEAVIKKLAKTKSYAKITKDTECKELSKAMSKLTGGRIKVMLAPWNYVNAYAKIPLLDNSNPLITKSMTTYKEGLDTDLDYYAFKKNNPDMIGGFDFKKNEFVGWAKDIKVELCLSYRCIYPAKTDNDMNPEVATFILLHEMGHIIEKVMGTGMMVRENYVLSQAHSRLMGVDDQQKRIKIVKEIAKAEGVKDVEDLVVASKESGTDSLYIVMIGKLREEPRSELDSYGYDQTGSESLADYFAVKQGYGLGATYLADTTSKSTLNADDITYIVQWTVIGALTWGSGSILLPGAITALGMAYSALAGYSYDSHSARYDNSRDRLERVINGYIENIRINGNKDGIDRKTIADAKRLLKNLESMPKDSRGAFQSIFEYVNPRGRRERSTRDLQKALESLSNHKLNIKLAEYQQA